MAEREIAVQRVVYVHSMEVVRGARHDDVKCYGFSSYLRPPAKGYNPFLF